ncbi:hypothetical protein GCM10023195_30330 [Actinoallomurus liliacearum]|uniref:Uncharacterized protein n=1 Tax=Actinoallomurus liliacearum TaxID=1080073 RepID=A0ABP8TGT3_9ACTN
MTHRPELPIDMENEQKMSLLSIELSQERIRDAERVAASRRDAAQVRAMRRARRDAEVTAVRLRRLLTTR